MQSAFVHILSVNLQTSCTVHLHSVGGVGNGDCAAREACVAVVIGKTLKINIGHDYCFCAHELLAEIVIGKEAGNASLCEELIKLLGILNC